MYRLHCSWLQHRPRRPEGLGEKEVLSYCSTHANSKGNFCFPVSPQLTIEKEGGLQDWWLALVALYRALTAAKDYDTQEGHLWYLNQRDVTQVPSPLDIGTQSCKLLSTCQGALSTSLTAGINESWGKGPQQPKGPQQSQEMLSNWLAGYLPLQAQETIEQVKPVQGRSKPSDGREKIIQLPRKKDNLE